jgi:hypothetical protein
MLVDDCEQDQMIMDLQHSYSGHQQNSHDHQHDGQSHQSHESYCEALCQIACHATSVIPEQVRVYFQNSISTETCSLTNKLTGFYPLLLRPPSIS